MPMAFSTSRPLADAKIIRDVQIKKMIKIITNVNE